MKNIILAWCLFYSSLTMAFPPVGAVGQSGTSTLYPVLNKAPYNQITNLGSGAALIETGSENMLVNPGFEALDNGSTPTGWTCTTGTCTTEKTIFTSGKQSMKVVPAANVFDVSQQVSIPANIQKQGVMGIAYNIPATCTTAQIEISADAVVQTTVPTANLILDGAFHSIEVPTTFGVTSAKLRAYSTATCTGNIYFDAAYVKQGIGFQSLQLDNVYSATVSAAGVVSNQNKSWITGNASIAGTSAYTITFNTGLFTVTPNCSVTIEQNNTNIALISAATNSSITVITYLASTAGTQSASNFTIICQKQGNDYLSSSSAVYSQASANYSNTYTPTFTGLGTPSSSFASATRRGDKLLVQFNVTAGTTTAVLAKISLPAGLSIDTTKIVTNTEVGKLSANNTPFSGGLLVVTTDATNIYFTSDGSAYNTGFNGNGWATGTTFGGSFEVPIAGWSNSAQIVGSFQGYNSTNGVNSPKLFSANITTTSGAVANQYGSIISSCTAANPTVCTLTGLTGTPNCGIGNTTAAAQNTLITAKSSSSITISTASASQTFDLFCQGQ